MDHDIHAYRIGNSLQTTLELAKKNNQDNYGDVIKTQHVIHFVDCTNQVELEAEFRRIGLAPRVQLDASQSAFWKPDEAVYSTKSTPDSTGKI